MIGALLLVTALLQGDAPQVPATEPTAGQAPAAPSPQTPPAPTSTATVSLKVGDYDLDQFKNRLSRAIDLIDAGDETAGLEELDALANQSMAVRRVRNLEDIERPDHGRLFVERAKGNLTRSADRVEDSLRQLLRVDPFGSRTLVPRVKQQYDDLLTKEAGTLEISSAVRGTNLFVDGALAGIAADVPTRVRVLAGEVEVRARKDGFPQDGVRTVTVVAAAVVSVSIAPRQVIPPLVLLSDQPDINITMAGVSGQSLRFTGLAALRSQLPASATAALDRRIAGSNLDALSVTGFVVPDEAIEVGKNISLTFGGTCLVELPRTISVTEELLTANASEPLLWLGSESIVRVQRDVGTLRVNSTPEGAEVFVEDPASPGVFQSRGVTPLMEDKCSGSYRVRVRHRRVGSSTTTAQVVRGQTRTVELPIKPGVAFLGAVDAQQASSSRVDNDLGAQILRALTATVTTFSVADRLQLPREVQTWTSQITVSLMTALDKNDTAAIDQWLKVASDNYEAPLMVAAVRRAPNDVELLFLWSEHRGVDRVHWSGQAADLSPLFQRVDRPVNTAELVYQNDIGIRFADTLLPGAPILIVRVDDTSSPLQVGEHIEAVDGTAMNARGLADRVSQKKPGEIISLRVSNVAAAQPRDVRVTVASKPRRAPVFDPNQQGNVLIAKLSAAALGAPAGEIRDLYNFNLAAAYMRFGEYRAARELLETVGNVPVGAGVGRGPAAYLKARALEALGQRDLALAALKEATTFKDQTLADDGAGVGSIAERHLAVFGKTP